MITKTALWAGLIMASAGLAACGEKTEAPDAASEKAAPMDNSARIDAVLAGDHRTEEERARDAFRHPKETLMFFGMKSTYGDHPELYGDVELSSLGEGHHIAPEGSADMVVTFRNIHSFMGRDMADFAFAEFFRALKPGGVLGIVEHRADGSELPHDGSSGYVYTDDVKAMAAAAGFEFDRASEINANAADTKDHPFGVWTLPPVRRSSEVRGQETPGFDRAKYDAIGESDRFTIIFRKPIAADGALLQ